MAEVEHSHDKPHDDEHAHHNHHVHFPESVGLNTEIQVTKRGNMVDVHLGFLQYKHKYEIVFVVPVAENGTACHHTNSLFIHICHVKPLDGQGQEVTLHLDAHKEGLLQDKFDLRKEATNELFHISLKARVLGPKKGTPMLKENIKCIAVEKDEEERDDSDWQGFD